MTEQEKQMEQIYPFMDDTNFRDDDGSIMPWYTKGALDWIKENISTNKETLDYYQVLEFGGGNSTLWWRKRADVVTIEYDKRACDILSITPMSPKSFFESGLPKPGWEIVIVDSEAEIARQDYIIRAFNLATHFVIIDNWQQKDVCFYDNETVAYLYENSKEQHIFNQPSHLDGSWKTAIFVK
jgi:hypothetical protein